ncbi:MAG TPA: hypothetical protein V6C65_04305 [Allocoleopsis sp.]
MGRLANFYTSLADAEQDVELEEEELDEIDPLEYEQELFGLVSENIDAAEANGLVTADDADALRADLLDEHRARLEELMELDPDTFDEDDDDEDDDEDDDDEDDEEYYSDGTALATFAAATATPFAEALLEVGQAVGYGSVEAYAADLADYLGIDDEEAIGLLTGDLVPDEEVFDALADGFGLDDDTYEALSDLADEAREMVYEEEDADAEDAAYSFYQDRRVSELENQIAEFQTHQAIADRLSALERDIDDCLENAFMPPYAKDLILGNFERESDRVAAFSQVCAANNVDPDIELYAMERIVSTFRRCFEGNPIAQFGSEIMEPITERALNRATSVMAQAKRNVELRRAAVGISI